MGRRDAGVAFIPEILMNAKKDNLYKRLQHGYGERYLDVPADNQGDKKRNHDVHQTIGHGLGEYAHKKIPAGGYFTPSITPFGTSMANSSAPTRPASCAFAAADGFLPII